MTRFIKVGPNDRLLIESGINRYKVLSPGLAWLKPWQRERARLYVGPNITSVECDKVRVVENVPVNVVIKVIYRINPDLFTDALLPRIPGLNEGGWRNIVKWQSEAVVRRWLARYDWHDLKEQEIQESVEQQLSNALTERLKVVGLEVIAITLIKTELDDRLQRTIITSEQDGIEAGGRAKVLKQYFEIFGDSLSKAMPYIVQWELLNSLHKNGQPHLLMTAAGLSAENDVPKAIPPQPVFQMKLPMPRDWQKIGLES